VHADTDEELGDWLKVSTHTRAATSPPSSSRPGAASSHQQSTSEPAPSARSSQDVYTVNVWFDGQRRTIALLADSSSAEIIAVLHSIFPTALSRPVAGFKLRSTRAGTSAAAAASFVPLQTLAQRPAAYAFQDMDLVLQSPTRGNGAGA